MSRTRIIAAMLALVCGASALNARSAPARSTLAIGYLTEAIKNPRTDRATLTALRATRDKDLLPLFVALSRSAEKDLRLFAAASLSDVGGAAAAPALLERVRKDPVTLVRAEALVHLLGLDAISTDQLVETIGAPDESIRCLAARALVKQGRADLARSTLTALTRSRDLATASVARMCLLGAGEKKYLTALEETFGSPKTPPDVLTLLLGQIAEEKIVPAAGLAEKIAASSSSAFHRLLAYEAIVAVCPEPAEKLLEAIGKSDNTVLRVRLLRILSGCPNAADGFEALGAGADSVAALARFELARGAGGRAAVRAVREALKPPHPIVVEYILARGREDIAGAAGKADFYAPGLLEYVRSVDPEAHTMRGEHVLAARTATLLADIGTPEAMAGMKEILTGRYGALMRVAAAGLMRSRNKAVCELIRPLLDSPYPELVTDAALTLGGFGDPAVADALRRIVANPTRYPPPLAVLAAWRLLKIAGEVRSAARAIAGEIR